VLRAAAAIGEPASRAVFYPGTPAGHTAFRGLVRGRSFTLQAAVSLERPDAEGVLFSQGSRTGGQVLFLTDGHLHYVCNAGGQEQKVTSARPIPLGRRLFEVRYARTGAVDGTMDMVGDVALLVDGQLAGTATRVRMTGLDIMQTVSAGRGVTYSVSAAYTSPFPFTGGGFDEVVLDFTGRDTHDDGAVVDTAFRRD
jgi:arylsulfatase